MFKLLAILFASLLTTPVLANANTSVSYVELKEASSLRVPAKGAASEYTYTEEFVPGTGGKKDTYYRYYDSRELGPSIYTMFCAPKGYVLKSSIDQSIVDIIYEQLISVSPNVDLSFGYTISYYYGIFGAESPKSVGNGRYYDGEDNIEAQRAWLKADIKNAIEGATILDIDDVSEQDEAYEVYARVSLELTLVDENYNFSYCNFTYRGEPVTIKPYGVDDFIDYKVSFDQEFDSKNNIKIECNLIPGFFNEYNIDSRLSYNSYGWTTSTTEEPTTGQIYCKYQLKLIAHNAIPLGTFKKSTTNNDGYEYEMSYPEAPFSAKIRLEFIGNDLQTHTYYSNSFMIGDPNIRITVDDTQDRKSVHKGTEHLYSIQFDNLEVDKLSSLSLTVDGVIDRLINDNTNVIYCYDGRPETGVSNVYYYVPSENEKSLHNAGKDAEIEKISSEGKYYVWDAQANGYVEINTIKFFDISNLGDGKTAIATSTLDAALNRKITFPFAGRISHFKIMMNAAFTNESTCNIEDEQLNTFEITSYLNADSEIILDVSDKVNLLNSGDDIVITPTLSSYDEGVTYYYDFEVSRIGFIDASQDEDGKVTVRPLKSGLVDLTFKVESSVFSTITKTISVRIIDGIYDNAQIETSDGFHKAGQDLDVSLSVRGFSDIQNAKVTWKVFDKNEKEISSENIVTKKNASMTLLKPDSNDYTIKAFYDNVEVSSKVVVVRYVDMDNFLRYNIWWIVLITAVFAAAVVFFATITKRGRSTVDRIARVYQVYCQCISNDSLSKEELVRIKREISKCLYHCESLNIDAFNQYEKATRYLRISLSDVKSLMKDYDSLSNEDKSVMYEKLNADLGKALNVAKEIENAKGLVEQYHATANRQNYEVLKDDKPKDDEK